MMSLSSNTDPLAVKAKIDYDADGTVDAELPATSAGEGDDLEGHGVAVDAQVARDPQRRVIVSFAPTERSASVAGVVYALCPEHPQLQLYSEPFIVDEGSYILYSAYGELGQCQATQELEVLGGIEDVQIEPTTNGDPFDIQTIVPGQDVMVTFNGKAGQTIEVTVGPVTGGIQPRNQATLVLTGTDGTVLREAGPYGIPALGRHLHHHHRSPARQRHQHHGDCVPSSVANLPGFPPTGRCTSDFLFDLRFRHR